MLAADSHPRGAGALGRMAVFDAGTAPRTMVANPLAAPNSITNAAAVIQVAPPSCSTTNAIGTSAIVRRPSVMA